MNEREPKSKKRDNLWLRALGIALTSGGGAFLGSAIARQIKARPGETYYDWMAIGATVVVVGFLILIGSRKKQS